MRNDAFGAVSELAATQHGVFTRQQAAQRGCSKALIGRLIVEGLVVEARPGVLVIVGAPTSWRQRLAIPTALVGVAASHRSAARLWRLDGQCKIDVVEVTSARLVRSPGVLVHRLHLSPGDVVVQGRIPCTSLARTLCDLGDVCGDDEVERALDDARRRGVSLQWLREVADRRRRPGASGPTRLLRALDSIEPSGRVRESWFERLVEMIVSDPSLPEVRRQYELHDSGGAFVARFDLAMPSIRLGFEAHSRQFHFGRDAERRDEDRDHRIAACGWDTMYLGWSSTQRPEHARRLVREVVAARSCSVGERPAPELNNFG